ncbi:MAG: hypothetical protein ACOYH0_00005, partial [Saccharofermentanales bacterium]
PSGVLFIHNLRLVPLASQKTRFRKALAQKASALDTVGSFAVNVDFMDLAPTLVYSFAVNIDILDFAPTPMCSFAVNIDFLDP